MADPLRIEVAYAEADSQVILTLRLPRGSRVMDAIEQSGITQRYPAAEVGEGNVGIFGRICGLQQKLADGDRVEIYRPLRMDPKQARRLRAKQQLQD